MTFMYISCAYALGNFRPKAVGDELVTSRVLQAERQSGRYHTCAKLQTASNH